MQDLSLCLVTKIDPVKLNDTFTDSQFIGIRCIHHITLFIQQSKHQVDIRQRMHHGAVNNA